MSFYLSEKVEEIAQSLVAAEQNSNLSLADLMKACEKGDLEVVQSFFREHFPTLEYREALDLIVPTCCYDEANESIEYINHHPQATIVESIRQAILSAVYKGASLNRNTIHFRVVRYFCQIFNETRDRKVLRYVLREAIPYAVYFDDQKTTDYLVCLI